MKDMKRRSLKRAVVRKRRIELKFPNVAGAFIEAGAPPIHVRTRPLWSGSGRHDLVYVSSYLHDAAFQLEELYESDNCLVIPVNRVRQELEKQQEADFECVRSEVLLGPIKWWTIEFSGRLCLEKTLWRNSPTLNIHAIGCSSGEFLPEASSDEEVFIDCTGARLRIRVEQDCVVQIVDCPPSRKRERVSGVTVRLAQPMG